MVRWPTCSPHSPHRPDGSAAQYPKNPAAAEAHEELDKLKAKQVTVPDEPLPALVETLGRHAEDRRREKVDLVVGCITTLKDEFHEPVDTGSLAGDIRALVMEGSAAFTSATAGLMKALIGEVQRNPELGGAVRERTLSAQRPRPAPHRAGRRAGRDPPAGRSRRGLQMIMGPLCSGPSSPGSPSTASSPTTSTLALRMLGAADEANPGPKPDR